MALAVEVRDTALTLSGRMIFDGLNFHLNRGESYFLIGASGSGKTLFLKLCAGLVTPDEGKVTIENIDLASAEKETLQKLRKRIGFVFQDSALLSNMAIFDNVALPLRYHQGGEEREIRTRVEEKMALCGVDRDQERSIPSQLSLGMRNRVALARALVLEPTLLFLDQPSIGLDFQAKVEISRTLRGYQERLGASILTVGDEIPSFVTHIDRVGILRGGRVAAEGTLEEMRAVLEKAPESDIHS